MAKGHANYKSTLKPSGQSKGQVGKPTKLMKMGADKVPQRRTHKSMSGIQMLNKLAGKPKANILSPLYKPAPKK